MKITLEDVARIARLAHLRFDGTDMERLRGELDRILAYIDTLETLDTDGAEPAMGAADDRVPPLRDDAPGPTLSTDDALVNAPESGRGHFKVPRVIG